jgi:hypothetical protein
VRRNRPPHVKSTAAPAAGFAGMEDPSADTSQQDRPESPTHHGLLTLIVMVVITCASIAGGLATLDCPTGKGRWGACNPQDPAHREETAWFIQRLLVPR